MATLLYRLGRFSFRHRWPVTLAWLVVLAAALVGMAALTKPASPTLSIPGTPAQEAIDLLDERFPQAAGAASAGTATARIVFAAPDGQTLTSEANKAVIGRALVGLTGSEQVTSITDPFQTQAVSPDGTVAYATATYSVAPHELTDAARTNLTEAIDTARAAGLTTEVSGSAAQEAEHTPVGEILGVIVAAIVLFITFGSLVSAGLPLLSAFIGVGLGSALIGVATHFFELTGTTSVLATMLGLAVAIDYALFIVSRYRHEVAEGRDLIEAAGRAIGTAGSAVVFAGLTVIIALAGLAVVGIPFLTEMGVAAAGTVAVAVLIALTLLPAMLGIAGRKVAATKARKVRQEPEGATPRPGLADRWVRTIVRRPVLALLATLVGLGAIAIPALDLRLGLPSETTPSPGSSQQKANDLIADAFGAGFQAPLTVVVDVPAGTATTAATRIAEQISGLDDVAMVGPAVPNAAGDTAVLTVIPASGPDDVATENLVHAIRDLPVTAGASIGVTGATALNLDISEKLADALIPYLTLVVGLAFILLALVFRSLLVPLKATIGFLLSVAATFGALVAVFQWGWLADLFGVNQTGPIISFLPVLLIGIVFGLAMDYQVFLVTRMREDYVHGAAPREAVVSGFNHGAPVVTAAALIMMSVFFGFMLGPEAIIKSIGFGLGIAILFDAIIVRMILVPAVMALLGHAAWWLPRWLDRAMPNVDVEGEQLLRHLRTTSETTEARPDQRVAHFTH
ncbi:MMPL family transporter [Micromonospora echinospora]|uniref:MMPL family transporter n=1 Tax=Micromonospora echinospora TaxID=1877 RepID=UPI0036700332